MEDRIKVLMIDDEEDLNRMVKENLEDAGPFEVVTSTDALRAGETCLRERPDVVLLDNVMPGKKGSDIAGELREDPATGDFPVIMVSGKGEFIYSFRRDQFQWKPNRPIVKDRGEIPEGHNVHELAQAFGTDDYISKPFSTEILIEVIRDVVERHRKKKRQQEEAGGGGSEI